VSKSYYIIFKKRKSLQSSVNIFYFSALYIPSMMNMIIIHSFHE